MLPDMSGVLTRWSQDITLKSVTQTVVDYEPVNNVTTSTIQAVVQPAEKSKLQVETIDWSKHYIWLHSASDINIGDFVTYKGSDYKVLDKGPYDDYGYYECIAEEVK